MAVAGTDLRYRGEHGWDRCLPGSVGTPADNSGIGRQRTHMKAASTHECSGREADRDARSAPVTSPADDACVDSDSTGSYSRRVYVPGRAESDRHFTLATAIVTPAHD